MKSIRHSDFLLSFTNANKILVVGQITVQSVHLQAYILPYIRAPWQGLGVRIQENDNSPAFSEC